MAPPSPNRSESCSQIAPDTWWYDAFPQLPYQSSPPGEKQMLILVAYDICEPKRLQQVARVCQDFGTRVQYSLFECRLEDAEFQDLWSRLMAEIDETEDRIVAYRLDSKSARETQTAGTMVCSEKVVCYLV